MGILDYLFGDTYRTPGINPDATLPTSPANITGMENTGKNTRSGLPNIFMTPDLAEAGLLGTGQEAINLQNALQSQATKAGLLSAGVSFLTQPRNLQAGSALPYLGRAYQQGMQSAGDIYGTGLRQYATQQAFGQKEKLQQIDAGNKVLLIDPRTGETVKEYAKNEIAKLANNADRLASSTYSQKYGRPVTFAELTPEEQQDIDTKLVNREINVVEREKFAEAKAKSMSAYQDKIDAAGDTAYDRTQDLNQLEALLSNVDAGGMGEETYTQFQSLLSTFGLGKDELVGNKQASIAISNRLAKALRKPGEGVMTDADFRVLKDSVPGLSQTPEGRAFLINSIRRMSEREMEIQDMAYKYLETNPSLDNNFKRQLLEFRKANPLFTQEELARMQGSKQVKKQLGTTTGSGVVAPPSKEFQSTDELIGLPPMDADGYYDIPV